ncbi:MAG TPA: hypothetical protein VEG64_10195 [Candidatus Sulfotelmatobacter sp.]|nr:hypothetical protein [Candidatus Sulfotelmatobacter sp.]
MITIGWFIAVGALAIAAGNAQETSQRKNNKLQIVREGSFELNTTAEKALPFFTPEGERAWAEGWDPKPIYPAQKDVAFETNAVFRLGHGEHESIWTILKADPEKHVAEYVYVVLGERVSRVRVVVEPLAANRCRVRVRYVHTALSEGGMQVISAMTEEAYAQKMLDWQRMVGALIR